MNLSVQKIVICHFRHYIIFWLLTLSTNTTGLECAGIIIIVMINDTKSFLPNVEKKCEDIAGFEYQFLAF